MNKAELMTDLRTEHERLKELIAPLSEAKISQSGAIGYWSIKDALFHIAYWTRWVLEEIDCVRKGKELDPSMTEDGEVINQRVYQQMKDKTVKEALADFDDAFKKAVKTIEALSEKELAEPWGEEESLAAHIAGFTIAHYQEHYDQIQAWLAQ